MVLADAHNSDLSPHDRITGEHTFFRLCFASLRHKHESLMSTNCAFVTAMSALPWPVDSVTEQDARSFFERGVDLNFPGSWYFHNEYTPRICNFGRNRDRWAVRFKQFIKPQLRASGTLSRKKYQFKLCTSHPSRQEAEARCYRDIYAKVHENASKFGSREKSKRKSAAADRDARASKRIALRDPEGAKQQRHDERVEKVRGQVRAMVARRSTLRVRKTVADAPGSIRRTSSVDIGANSGDTGAVPRAPTAKERSHHRKVQASVKKAEEAMQKARHGMEEIRVAYNKLQFSGDNAYVDPKDTCVVARADRRVVSNRPSTDTTDDRTNEEEEAEDSECDNDPLPLDTAFEMASMTNAQAHNLVCQMKCVFYHFYWLEKQWAEYVNAVKSLNVGEKFPRIPSVESTLLKIRAAWDKGPAKDFNLYEVQARTTNGGRLPKTKFHPTTMRKWVVRWTNDKTFKIPSHGGGQKSWYVAERCRIDVCHTQRVKLPS